MLIPNEGLLLWMLWAFNNSDVVQEDFVIDLFQNDYVPIFTSTGTSFAVATFPGYSQVPLLRDDFAAPTAAGGTGTIVSSTVPTWTCTGGPGQDVYGWYLRGASSGKVLAAQNFATPPVMVAGLSVTLGPMTFQMGQFS